MGCGRTWTLDAWSKIEKSWTLYYYNLDDCLILWTVDWTIYVKMAKSGRPVMTSSKNMLKTGRKL